MAVRAQYPSNAFSIRSNVLDEFQPHRENLSSNLFCGLNNYAGQQILIGTVFSEPESALTCNVSGSRKRNRGDQMVLTQQNQQQQVSQQLLFANLPEKTATTATAVSSSAQLSYEENRLYESGGTSTSGRSPGASPSVVSPVAQDLGAYLYRQNLEFDALIRLQNEKLRSVLEDSRKTHCRSILLFLEQQVLKKLKVKEIELENANRRKAELEEKVKQMSAENQIWFDVAKNNETIASSLKSSLEQILLQKAGQTKEGFGESDGMAVLANDAQSCCYEVTENDKTSVAEKTMRKNRELKHSKSCKVCRQNDVSVLLLPCRHLCLCKCCESKIEYCPICQSMKNASLQIFMS
ncbi:hypothetical protein HHK36_025316 [Tetracentron sinense]|uniref:RING-type domain-containing protein n=1 Tax=Tetracentron sinense TaxID=13715 RepID=A0A834YQN6_TETSI|nr:hypothetical protein HHK36_025316 [Tetracentron sinense]